jgi:hypothetical protein
MNECCIDPPYEAYTTFIQTKPYSSISAIGFSFLLAFTDHFPAVVIEIVRHRCVMEKLIRITSASLIFLPSAALKGEGRPSGI